MVESTNLPETWRDLEKRSSRIRPLPIGEVEVLVVADTADLRGFTDKVFEEINSFCSSQGAHTPITADELAKYFATALMVRVKHIARKPRDIRVEDRWSLPFPMQYIVSAIGVVDLESPMVTVFPAVTRAAEEELLLSRLEWESISRRLGSLEPLGLRMAKALESKREGVARVMCLLLVRGESFEILSDKPFTVTDALTAKAAGLSTNVRKTSLISSNPIWVPPYTMDGREVLTFEHKFAEIGFRRAPA